MFYRFVFIYMFSIFIYICEYRIRIYIYKGEEGEKKVLGNYFKSIE